MELSHFSCHTSVVFECEKYTLMLKALSTKRPSIRFRVSVAERHSVPYGQVPPAVPFKGPGGN